jgi:hypothetical protein
MASAPDMSKAASEIRRPLAVICGRVLAVGAVSNA